MTSLRVGGAPFTSRRASPPPSGSITAHRVVDAAQQRAQQPGCTASPRAPWPAGRPVAPSAMQRRRPVRAASSSAEPSGAPAGQISADLMESMRSKITDALAADAVKVVDVYGDGRHVSIDVVSKAFEGQSAVARQRMVYKAIWVELQEAVHAVDAMSTKTPEEAGAA